MQIDRSIKDYLAGFDVWKSPWEAENFINNSLWRIQRTLQLLQKYVPKGGKVLELGAAPYYTTLLLKKFTDYQIHITDYLEELESQREREVVLTNPTYGETFRFPSYSLNLEKDPLPFEANTFDAVLCCEILEHLAMDPAYMIYQIHRVLKKDAGILILTTPNVIRFENIVHLLGKRTVYHPYSGYGIYGRHNKEYTPQEVKTLLEACNYEIKELETGLYGMKPPLQLPGVPARVSEIVDKAWNRALDFLYQTLFKDRREALFVVARAYGESRPVFPEGIYAYMHVFYRFIYYYDNNIKDETSLRCVRGWYPLEEWNTGFHRWTQKEAVAYLRNNGKRKLVLICYVGGTRLEKFSGSLFINGELVKRFELEGKWWRQIEHRLEKIYTEPELEIKISMDRTWVPGGGDPRELGIAVRSLVLIE